MTSLTLGTNGAIIPAGVDRDAIAKHLDAKDVAYLERMDKDLSVLMATEAQIEQRMKDLQSELRRHPAAVKLAEAKKGLKQIRARRDEKLTKIVGVIERAMENTGTTLADMAIAASNQIDEAELSQRRRGRPAKKGAR